MLTISETIIVGKISAGYAVVYNEKQKLFSPALAAHKSPVLIQMVTDALEWGNDGGAQTNATLRGIANYLIWLCGKFSLEAQGAIGGGGTVVVVPPGGLGSLPTPYYFIVENSGSFMVTGDTTKVITSFKGYNIVFFRNGIEQTTVNTEPTYFSWNKLSGEFIATPALLQGELIGLVPV